MKTLISTCQLVIVVLLLSPTADGATKFRAVITSDQENPPIPDEGSSGIGIFELNDTMDALSYSIQLFGLDLDGNQTVDPNDDVTRTHIHVGAPGTNGGIVFGQIDTNPALRNDLDDLVVDPVNGTLAGVWDNTEGNGTTLAAQLSNLLAGNLYFNVHTFDHGGGEIRGQILFVPEPGSLAMVLVGSLGLPIGFRRRINR